MSGNSESGFSFVDKRRATQDSVDSSNSTTSDQEPTPDEVPTDADNTHQSSKSETSDEQIGAMPRLNVRDRLLMCIDILNQGAWISLGLISDPASGSIETDLNQAKTAIDCVAFLAEKVEHELDESTKRELRSLVRDLQLNFVQQSSH
jgi:hypothetical protein